MLYLYGASGHGMVIADIVRLLGFTAIAYIDDADKGGAYNGLPCYQPNEIEVVDEDRVIVTIGNNLVRRKVALQLGCSPLTAIHPRAIVAGDVQIAQGSVVMAGAVVNSGSVIGGHSIVNTGAVVDHECNIGDFVHISPNATLCGQVVVEDSAWVGAGAVILPGIRIGQGSIVGAGAVVVKNVESGTTVMGNPARARLNKTGE